MKYKLVVFDMDGTILNTLTDLTNSINYALNKYGYPLHTEHEVRQYVGNGLYKTTMRAMPSGSSEEETQKVFDEFANHYAVHSKDSTKPYPGIVELLHELKALGYKTAVVSNKADAAVVQLSEEFFPGLFDVSIGEREGVAKKPAPDEVNLALNKLNMSSTDAVYIGDSDVDMETAYNSKLDLIAVDWGFKDRSFLEERGAQIIVSSALDILKYL